MFQLLIFDKNIYDVISDYNHCLKNLESENLYKKTLERH